MTGFDYALGLLTILMGLALADISFSLHKLLVRARSVKWDWRVPFAAALVVVDCVRLWFAQWTLRGIALALTFPVYLGLFAQMMILVLLATACLPDDPADDCDLSQFYEQRRRYFWGLYAAEQALFFLLWLAFGSTSANGLSSAGPLDWFRVLGPLAAFALLALVRRRWLDYAFPAGLILFYLACYWHSTLA